MIAGCSLVDHVKAVAETSTKISRINAAGTYQAPSSTVRWPLIPGGSHMLAQAIWHLVALRKRRLPRRSRVRASAKVLRPVGNPRERPLPGREEPVAFCRRNRPREQVSLSVSAADPEERISLLLALDSFGGGLHVHRGSQVADLLNENHRARRMWQLRREQDVELQMVEGEPADVGERREGSTEVVQR